MNNKKDTDNVNDKEDNTKYGEFVSSFFNWNTLESQKEKVNRLENIMKSKDKKENNRKKEK